MKYFVQILIKHGIPQTKSFGFSHEVEAAISAKQ
jgi:hypothetical protein